MARSSAQVLLAPVRSYNITPPGVLSAHLGVTACDVIVSWSMFTSIIVVKSIECVWGETRR